MHAIVHAAASLQNRDGSVLLMATLFGHYSFWHQLCADGSCQGAQSQAAVKRLLANLEVSIVKRSDQIKGFLVLPKRWIVERSIQWLTRCRRLAKDWEAAIAKRAPFCSLAPSASCFEGMQSPIMF